MTDHIVSFSVGIDDEAIRKSVMELSTKQIVNEIKTAVANDIFTSKSYYSTPCDRDPYGNVKISKDASLKEKYANLVKELFEENKDEIISRAAEILADSYKRTKVWKEATAEVLNE